MKNKIKNLKETAQRIKKAVQNNEKIILYGDSDMDGIASVVILEEAIKNLGGNISVAVFPDRENDGYGVNFKALEFLKDKAPALFITLDLGIANVKEVETANKMGFEVIIIDHHEPLDEMPDAQIIVDPRQEGDKYYFKGLCNAGLTFKLCEEILSSPSTDSTSSLQTGSGQVFSENLKNSFLEMVALATISDMVPQVDDNKIFIENGLRSLKNTFRPGLRAFLDTLGEGEVAAGGFSKIISALNAAESADFKNESYELLTSNSSERCRELAEKLLAKTQFKQQKIKQITEEVERRITQKKDEEIIFEGDPAWRLVWAGAVASIIASKYKKPTFIFRKGDYESCGSARSLKEGQNSVDAMKACSDLLMTYGGHAKASGFRLKNENLEKFKDYLKEYFEKR